MYMYASNPYFRSGGHAVHNRELGLKNSKLGLQYPNTLLHNVHVLLIHVHVCIAALYMSFQVDCTKYYNKFTSFATSSLAFLHKMEENRSTIGPVQPCR